MDVIGSIQISVKRFLRAGLNSRFPKSPPGFIVPITKNPSSALISSTSSPPFSGNTNILSFSVSNIEFNLSKTLSSARDISSMRNIPPYFIALFFNLQVKKIIIIFFNFRIIEESKKFDKLYLDEGSVLPHKHTFC